MSSHVVEVVRVDKVEKHPNADRLELVYIKGWVSIIQTGQFKVGDLAVYIPIDSVLPEAMVEKHKLEYLKNGARVRTVKLRGAISQGLLLPPDPGTREGQNVAAIWGITKWEPPSADFQPRNSPRKATRLRPNPNFARYTDIENIKNFPNVFEDGERVVITEKIHGTNARYGMVERHITGLWSRLKTLLFGKWEFVVGSHNVQLTAFTPKHAKFYAEDVYTKIAKRYRLNELIPPGYTLYGEIYGKGVQDLTYGLDDIDVAFFDLKKGERYLSLLELGEFCADRRLPLAPILYRGPWSPDLLGRLTDGASRLSQVEQIREGCVVRPEIEANHFRVGRKILKSVSADYLLRKNGTEFH